jgi:hypothetical protein
VAPHNSDCSILVEACIDLPGIYAL